MTTSAPPRPPDLAPDELEALIEEARRRARRRRAWYGASALLAAAAAVAGFWGFHNGGGQANQRAPAKPSASGSPQHGQSGPIQRGVKNGPLAIIDGGRIITVGASGRVFRSLPICKPSQCGEPQSVAWSPDGKTLAYGAGVGPGGPYATRNGLHLFDVTRKKDAVVVRGDGGMQDLSWSPDGKLLAYDSGASIYVIQVSPPQRPALFRASATSPSWSPGGRLIAYDRCHGFRYSGIDVARPDGSHVHHLSRFGCAPAWSPDGSRIAYVTRCGVRLMTASGKDITPNSVWRCAHVGIAGSPVWSPDGRRIAVAGAEGEASGTTPGTEGIYVMNADGSGLRRIWDGWTARPSWRPLAR